jgi:hypothetical protein
MQYAAPAKPAWYPGCDTRTSITDKEFEVKEGSTAARKARKDRLPSGLILIAMCELDVGMLERNCSDINNSPCSL